MLQADKFKSFFDSLLLFFFGHLFGEHTIKDADKIVLESVIHYPVFSFPLLIKIGSAVVQIYKFVRSPNKNLGQLYDLMRSVWILLGASVGTTFFLLFLAHRLSAGLSVLGPVFFIIAFAPDLFYNLGMLAYHAVMWKKLNSPIERKIYQERIAHYLNSTIVSAVALFSMVTIFLLPALHIVLPGLTFAAGIIGPAVLGAFALSLTLGKAPNLGKFLLAVHIGAGLAGLILVFTGVAVPSLVITSLFALGGAGFSTLISHGITRIMMGALPAYGTVTDLNAANPSSPSFLRKTLGFILFALVLAVSVIGITNFLLPFLPLTQFYFLYTTVGLLSLGTVLTISFKLLSHYQMKSENSVLKINEKSLDPSTPAPPQSFYTVEAIVKATIAEAQGKKLLSENSEVFSIETLTKMADGIFQGESITIDKNIEKLIPKMRSYLLGSDHYYAHYCKVQGLFNGNAELQKTELKRRVALIMLDLYVKKENSSHSNKTRYENKLALMEAAYRYLNKDNEIDAIPENLSSDPKPPAALFDDLGKHGYIKIKKTLDGQLDFDISKSHQTFNEKTFEDVVRPWKNDSTPGFRNKVFLHFSGAFSSTCSSKSAVKTVMRDVLEYADAKNDDTLYHKSMAPK